MTPITITGFQPYRRHWSPLNWFRIALGHCGVHSKSMVCHLWIWHLCICGDGHIMIRRHIVDQGLHWGGSRGISAPPPLILEASTSTTAPPPPLTRLEGSRLSNRHDNTARDCLALCGMWLITDNTYHRRAVISRDDNSVRHLPVLQ